MAVKPIVHTSDVLIIGGGFSGMWAAIRASQQGRSVLVVDKGPRDWRGLGMVSGGDMIVMQPEFDVKDLLDELVYYYDGLCDQEQLAVILEASYDRFRDLENWGHIFARDEKGTLLYVPQRGLSFMRYYLYHPYGKGGIHTTDTLQAKMDEYGARRISNVEITELIKQDGRVCGAVGFHARGGAPCVFRAGAVVLCAHTGGWKQSYLSNTCAGEGAMLAFHAGARLRNMEFLQHWNVPVQFAWEGQTGMLPYGARFLNGNGEDFMRWYSPKRGAKVDPHYNIRGMALEAREGRGPVWFDTSTMSEEGVRVMTPTGGWMLLNDQKLKKIGIDFFNMKTPWMPQLNNNFGGVAADTRCRTDVPGLYVAGRALSVHTGVYMGGWDTCITSTTGYIAGEEAAAHAGNVCPDDMDMAAAKESLNGTLGLLGKPGIAPKDIVRRMQEIVNPVDVSILKTGEGLSRALAELEDVRDNILPGVAASEPHYLLKLVEARAMTLLTEMYLKAALARKESRCGHFREDYPSRLPRPAWVVLEKRDGEVRAALEPVPLERYPIQPHRYYMDDFNYPDQPRLGASPA